MKSIEISARTVTEAVELALAQLGKDRDEVMIAVLEPGEAGDEALVRVTVVDDDDDEPVSALPITRASSTDDVQTIAQTVLDELLARMDIHAYVTPVVSRVPGQKGDVEETITLHVEGADEEAMGLLIGRRGETLRSLQFMLNLLVSRQVQKWPQIVVDVGNYRQRRQESLEGLARRMAERVRQTGRPMMLEPMAAYERRIVHLALRDDKTIYTESSGEGENRKIVIFPARS
ncbi:KH domain-containing protein [Candidatus Chloroploca sp. M-50]|uniref:RNA-binding protein KhpB n=2 Tax=Candidatus Chloroploca TaxID=1579476 RepID=A0A2H3KMX7_9CHLR|nr:MULTISPECIES: RNA-binding cell elongation regulator Jag/EloR [Candidatus Chloroploca]MBP1465910.1 KH domain-containing protein [Candidatus Chloroploca mongolica]PDV99482.1 single-stranded DNA-binding protein [Candidatus Chloroploca asiatica]